MFVPSYVSPVTHPQHLPPLQAAITKHAISCAVPASFVPDDTTTVATDESGVADPTQTGGSVTIQTPASTVMYAIIHPDAVTCTGPDRFDYDRASLLQNLGYWVKIWDSPVSEGSLTDQPFIADNIGECNDHGLDDLMKVSRSRMF